MDHWIHIWMWRLFEEGLVSHEKLELTNWPRKQYKHLNHVPILCSRLEVSTELLPNMKYPQIMVKQLKAVYPIVFVPNIFPNLKLIRRCAHIWQLKKQNDHKTSGNFKANSKRIYYYFCWNEHITDILINQLTLHNDK